MSEELLKEVDDTPGPKATPAEQPQDKLDRAVKGIRRAGGKLDEKVNEATTEVWRIQIRPGQNPVSI